MSLFAELQRRNIIRMVGATWPRPTLIDHPAKDW
jgi:hypothetical protein